MKRGTSGINMVIGVDKPCGMTSHDVVDRVRRALGERRVGHAGTLDPMASGVLVVGVGQATRLMALATAKTKRYLARFSFGRETTTDDAQGEIRVEAPAPERALDLEWARAQMAVLRAMRMQEPPAYSAIKLGGVAAYEAARRGNELDLAPRPIEVLDAAVCSVGVDQDQNPWWDLVVTVSKGTYVRALARDLGRELGSAAHVGQLRRIASGKVTQARCVELDELVRLGAQVAPLDPVDVLECSAIEVGPDDVFAVCDGRRLSVARTAQGAARGAGEGERLAIVSDGALYAVATRQGPAIVPQTVFRDGIRGVGAQPPRPGDVSGEGCAS